MDHHDVQAAVRRGLARRVMGMPSDISSTDISNLDMSNTSSLDGLSLGVSLAAITITALVVSARLLVRRIYTRQFFLDDALIVLATLFNIVLCAVTIVAATTYGLGKHVWNLELDDIYGEIKHCIQLMFVGGIFYACAITFTKLSIISSYLRIFPYQNLHYIMYGTMVVTVGLLLASVPLTIFQCSPVSAAWDFTQTGAKCINYIDFLYVSTAINITTDIVLSAVPLPYFWKLKMPRKQKLIVSGLFFIGGLAAIANIIRIATLHELSGGIDITYHLVSSLMWSIAECTIGIVCVSFPPMRPLFARILPRVFTAQTTARDTAFSGPGGGRRRQYPMGIISKTSNVVVESGSSQTELTDDFKTTTVCFAADPESPRRTKTEETLVDRDNVWDGSYGSGRTAAIVGGRREEED